MKKYITCPWCKKEMSMLGYSGHRAKHEKEDQEKTRVRMFAREHKLVSLETVRVCLPCSWSPDCATVMKSTKYAKLHGVPCENCKAYERIARANELFDAVSK